MIKKKMYHKYIIILIINNSHKILCISCDYYYFKIIIKKFNPILKIGDDKKQKEEIVQNKSYGFKYA